MIPGSIYRLNIGECLIRNANKTQTSLERMRGLLGRPKLADDEALLISPCSSIHTIGMGYPLDIAYLDNTGRVLKTVSTLVTMRFSSCWSAAATLEMPAGSLQRLSINLGEILEWRATHDD
ncbi:MAG: hypothetical protein BMS9Abin26_1485 [Gammaproteobacteria bacterium]|nr:MAG: hypothetical protein BMS9Abin26_1485 [Gammaproteobacteria bacterium]